MAKKDSSYIEHCELFLEKDIHIPTKTMWIGALNDSEEIDEDVAERAIKNLHILDRIYNDKPINIFLNSGGGCVVSGMAIYDEIKLCKSHVILTIKGQASSMASVIVQAADERIISPNSLMMIHEGDDTLTGHKKVIKAWNDWGEAVDRDIEKIYLDKIKEKKPRFTHKKLLELLDHDTIFKAKLAIEYGLVDTIREREE